MVVGLVSACAPQQNFNLIDPAQKKAFLGHSWVFSDKVRVAATGMTEEQGSSVESSSMNGTIGITNGSSDGSMSNGGSGSSEGGTSTGGTSGSGTATNDSLPGTATGESNNSNLPQPPAAENQMTSFAKDDPVIPINYLCSNVRSKRVGGNVKSFEADYTVQLIDKESGDVVCQMTGPEIRAKILNEKKLMLPKDCPGLGEKSYKLKLTSSQLKENTDLLYGSFKMGEVVMAASQEPSMSGGKSAAVINSNLFVLFDKNVSGSVGDNDDCDRRSSPLFIDLRGLGGQTELSSIISGVQFDILGDNAKPYPHTKKQISWFKENDYVFVVKPNAKGQVNGVDEMFGNNTRGPDGKMAHDGFAALAKFDFNRDGIIDQRDAVYNQLRLWLDLNHNGVADLGELSYLDASGVVAIDLLYNKNYYEKDKYGNEIYFKSVVKMHDNSVRLIFDLWFRYL